MRKAVFLDLNGTLVLPLKQECLAELTEIPGARHAVAELTAAGFICPVITVQSRIAKGLFTRGQFAHWFRAFAESWSVENAVLVGPYVCPHRYLEPCECKKPNTLLYDRAAADHEIDVTRSFVIGDSPDDMVAAERLGARGYLVRTGWAADERVAQSAACDSAVMCPSIVEAARWILSDSRGVTV